MRTLGAALLIVVLAGVPGRVLACACCTSPGQRYVEVEKLDATRREQIEQVRFAKRAELYLTEAGFDVIQGLEDPSEQYDIGVSWEKDRVVFALTGTNGASGTLTLAVPGKISIFEVDPRDGSDRGFGPILYKEWKLTGKASGTGVFAAGGAPEQLLTLILQGRGIGCTTADHFGHWTLVMQGPKANYTLFGDLVVP